MQRYIKVFIKTLFIILFLLFIFISSINKKVIPYVVNYTSVQTKKVAIEALKNTGLKEVNKIMKNNDNSIKITKNIKGEIESIDFDTTLFNEVLLTVSKSIRKKLENLEKGMELPNEMYKRKDKRFRKGIIYEIPLMISSNNVFLANLGPRIPIKIEYSGNVGLDIKSRVKPYGINSALVEIYIYVEVTQRTVGPFYSDDVLLTSEIPVVIRLVKGSVSNGILDTNVYNKIKD